MEHAPRYKELNLGQLRSFCQVAAGGSFTAAAAELDVSPSAVWQQVRGLERIFGSRLIVRRGRRVTVTPEGQLLLQLARGHVGGIEALPRLFAQFRPDLAPTVVLASPQGLFNLHLPRVVRRFQAKHPATRFQINLIGNPEIPGVVERGVADLGLASFDPNDHRPDGLVYEDLFRLRLCLFTPTRHPLNRRAIDPAEVVRYPLILSPRGKIDDQLLQRWLNRFGVADEIRPVMEVPFLETIARCVVAGIGVGLVYVGPYGERVFPGVRVRVIATDPSTMVASLIRRRGGQLAPSAEAFRQDVLRGLRERSFANEPRPSGSG